jgi:ABC-type transporter Mla subunit MlaD
VRRLVAILALLAAAIFLVTSTTSSGDDGKNEDEGGYQITGVFDSAVAAVPGEDVKSAGARIGSIKELDVNKERKAEIIMTIRDERFTPFHADAHCALRPEGLLAVKFIECDPGSADQPVLEKLDDGTYYLPVDNTSSPVDVDLLNNMMRNPTGQEFAILLSEFGTGLAGRGEELNAVIHRANPALGETDKVLQILAQQSAALRQFADDADRLLKPLAAKREAIAGFIKSSGDTAAASASRSAQLEASIQKLPRFLTSLRDQMVAVQQLTDQGVPFLASLRPAAPALSRATEAIAPFARQATPAVQSLGSASDKLDPLLQRTRPLIDQLGDLGRTAAPVARDLDAIFTSFESELGIRSIMNILYGATNAVNGFDDVGHYARVEPLSGACSEYTSKGFFGCDAQWGPTADSAKPIGPVYDTSAQSVATPTPTPTATPVVRYASEEPVLLDYLLAP